MRATSAQCCTSFVLLLALASWSVEALATPKQESLENLRRGTAEVFVSYIYQAGHPPDVGDLLTVARAQCRRMGYTDAVRNLDPTLKQCIAFAASGAMCVREMATDSFHCTHEQASARITGTAEALHQQIARPGLVHPLNSPAAYGSVLWQALVSP